jgi:CBS domain-containing protein
MTVGNFVGGSRSDIITVHIDDKVEQVVAVLAERRIGCVPVVDASQVVGIFSERDVIYGLTRAGTALLGMQVKEVMTSPPITISSNTPIISALSLMSRRRIRHLPIVDGEKLVGFVSIGDLVKWRIDRIESEAESMRSYIQSV